jgi:hypothetical protein
MLLGLAVVFALVAGVNADDAKKEVTLKGTITCAKCDLKVEGQTKCATVIKVKEGDKDVVYYFDDDSHKKNHSKVCQESKKGEVSGTVAEKDGKKWITVSKIKFD